MTTQGIETGTAETEGLGAKQESPVGNADAPKPNSNRPTQGSGGGADVTQADREAAAGLAEALAGRDGISRLPERFRSGAMDNADAVQAFARQRVAAFNGEGFVFFNPDTGEEYARNHPVESGEVPDATDVRRSTGQEDHLYDAFQAALASTPSNTQGALEEESPS